MLGFACGTWADGYLLPPVGPAAAKGGKRLYDQSTSLHEAGHGAAADLLDCRVRFLTAVPGESHAGLCHWLAPLVRDDVPRVEAPFVTWSGAWQKRLAGDVVVLLAGSMSAELFARPAAGAVRLPEGVSDQALERLEGLAADEPAAASAAELAEAARYVNDPGLSSDAEQIANIAFVAHGGDQLRASSWLRWLSEECRALLIQHEHGIRRVAALLQVHGVLGEEAVAACLRPEGARNG